MAKTAGEGLDHRSGGDADLTGAIKERVSPAVQTWLDLITDVIVEKVIKEQRAKWEEAQKQLDASGEEKRPAGRQPRRSGPFLDDQGQKVVKPKGRLLTVQEAADYLGMSRASLAGRGSRDKNRLPAIKIGRAIRFDLQMLDRWIERHQERLPRLFAEGDES